MTEPEKGFAAADPSVEDGAANPDADLQDESAAADTLDESEAAETQDEAEPSRGPRRQFGRIAWTLVAVIAVVGALTVVELVRISAALNRTACIQRAQADLLEVQGPGVSPTYAALIRLTGQNQLSMCGQ